MTRLAEPDPDEVRNWVLRDLMARWEPSSIERLAALVDPEVQDRCDQFDRVIDTIKQTDEITKMLAPVYDVLEQIPHYEVTNEVAIDPKRGRLGGLQGPRTVNQHEAVCGGVSACSDVGLSLPGPGSSLHGY